VGRISVIRKYYSDHWSRSCKPHRRGHSPCQSHVFGRWRGCNGGRQAEDCGGYDGDLHLGEFGFLADGVEAQGGLTGEKLVMILKEYSDRVRRWREISALLIETQESKINEKAEVPIFSFDEWSRLMFHASLATSPRIISPQHSDHAILFLYIGAIILASYSGVLKISPCALSHTEAGDLPTLEQSWERYW